MPSERFREVRAPRMVTLQKFWFVERNSSRLRATSLPRRQPQTLTNVTTQKIPQLSWTTTEHPKPNNDSIKLLCLSISAIAVSRCHSRSRYDIKWLLSSGTWWNMSGQELAAVVRTAFVQSRFEMLDVVWCFDLSLPERQTSLERSFDPGLCWCSASFQSLAKIGCSFCVTPCLLCLSHWGFGVGFFLELCCTWWRLPRGWAAWTPLQCTGNPSADIVGTWSLQPTSPPPGVLLLPPGEFSSKL